MPTPASPKTKPARKKKTSDYIAKAIVFLMLTFFGIVVNLVTYDDFTAIKDDLWLNSHGVLARNPSLYVYHGQRIASRLCAYYDTQQDERYSKCIELWFPLVFIDEHSPEIIHYDPKSPKHISTSWGRQVLISRTFSFMVALVFALIADMGLVFAITEKITGIKVLVASPPLSPTEAGSGLQSSARELSATLSQILTDLQAQTGVNAPYANAVAIELAPLAAQFNRALETRSREQASSALDEVVACINDFKAAKKERKMHLGWHHWQTMRKYESLVDIFRETRYRNATL